MGKPDFEKLWKRFTDAEAAGDYERQTKAAQQIFKYYRHDFPDERVDVFNEWLNNSMCVECFKKNFGHLLDKTDHNLPLEG